MKAQVLKDLAPIENRPLELIDLPIPQPKSGEILVKISPAGFATLNWTKLKEGLSPDFRSF